jgi:hypothetical protein
MQLSANIKTYWLLLKDLSNEEKRSLIELLTQSVKASTDKSSKTEKQETPNEDNWIDAFYGSWNDTPETAEELIRLIEGARTTGRPIEAL